MTANTQSVPAGTTKTGHRDKRDTLTGTTQISELDEGRNRESGPVRAFPVASVGRKDP